MRSEQLMIEPAMATSAPRLGARYVLHERLGSGGQGEVWRAHDCTRNIEVALKILRPGPGRSGAAWQALLHEYASASRLDHPHVLRVYAPEREGGSFYLPMEFAAGGDLRRLRGADYLAIVPVLVEVAQALEHAHECGVIHRDLKPGNVLFDGRGCVKVADFGVSGRAPDPGTDAMIRGLSPFTASPEQLRGEPPVPADDIYGLGALAYELFSGHPPHYPNFDARRVQQEPAPPLVPVEPIPPQLAALIARMLAKRASERPASMREVIDELDASLNSTLTFDFDTAEPPRNAVLAHRTGDHDEVVALHAEPTVAGTAGVTQASSATRAVSTAPSPRAAAIPPGVLDGPALWEELREAPLPIGTRLEPMRGGPRWPLLVLGGLGAAAVAAFLWLPRDLSLDAARRLLHATPPSEAPIVAVGASAGAQSAFDQRLAALEARGADVWGGADFAAAKARVDEAVGARDAGSRALAQQRLSEALQLLDKVEHAAPDALGVELAAGEQALAAGQAERALQAFDLAARIDPNDQRAALGQSRARRLSGVLPLLADAGNAQSSGQYSRAARDYTQALALDPNNDKARTGLERARSALDDDSYAKAAGEGYAALGAGRLDEARAAFERARALRANGAEAQEGLRRVDAAAAVRNLGAMHARAEALESQERWDEALRVYEDILRQDGSLGFAQAGKTRAADRLLLGESLQELIDRPGRLSSPQVREQAAMLLQSAEEQPEPGEVLRGQIARLSALLPGLDKPVHLALVSDSLTQVAIPSIGTFGSFARREIELKPGRYTVIGTRDGYHEVRRDITINPGAENLTVNVSCADPI